jgi:hypothetical protein
LDIIFFFFFFFFKSSILFFLRNSLIGQKKNYKITTLKGCNQDKKKSIQHPHTDSAKQRKLMRKLAPARSLLNVTDHL